MPLPEILDVAIGLLFIYLILSLLASEIQELIATLLQWRAKHLKGAIESLLAGGSESPPEELSRVRTLTNEIYSDPLINTLNQESRGPLTSWFRNVIKFWGSLSFKMYCMMLKKDEHKEKVLGNKNSAPSYMQAETFATSLFKTLGIQKLVQTASGVSLENFSQGLIEDIRSLEKNFLEPDVSDDFKTNLSQELNTLEERFYKIVQSLKTNKATLTTSLTRLEETLTIYIEDVKYLLPERSEFLRRLKLLNINNFSAANKVILLRSLQRSVTEVLDDYQDIKKALLDPNIESKEKNESKEKLKKIYGSFENLVEERVIKNLPDSLIESLSVLAKRTQIKVEEIDKELNHFQKEVETWFDRSMDRATGVYRRNSKGVAILIGIWVAIASNADTIHITKRLSKDSALRTAITERAIRSQKENDKDLRQIKQDLEAVSLPIGWSSTNTCQQRGLEVVSIPINGNSTKPCKQIGKAQQWFPYFKILLGWILSGLAIAMGAPFWFDMLSKVTNVRNAGPRPKSSTEDKQA